VSIHSQSLLSLRQARTQCSLYTYTAYRSPLDQVKLLHTTAALIYV